LPVCFVIRPSRSNSKLRALDLAFVNGELLAQCGRRGQRLTGSNGLVADLSFDLLAHLHVDRIMGAVFQFDVHRQSVRVTFDNERGASGLSPFASANNAAKSCPGTM